MGYHAETLSSATRSSTRTRHKVPHKEGRKGGHERSEILWYTKVVIKVHVHFCWIVHKVTDLTNYLG